MDEENSQMEESCDVEYVCGDPKVDIRVGDEYQADIPPMMSESKRASFLSSPLASNDSSCSFAVGLPIEVMWIDAKYRDYNIDMNESLRSLKTKRNRKSESDAKPMSLEALPGKLPSSWEDLEVDSFVLGLYTFGKNFTQIKKLLGSKETGDVVLYYYGKFYKSAKYKIWYNSLKKPSRKCIQGKKLYSGWRLQQLLSRLIPGLTDEPQRKKLVDVSKSFAEGYKSLEEYISAVKELVGLRSLVKAVAIGKEKEDLTVLTTEPVKSKQWFKVSSSAVASGLGDYTSLTCDEIISKLSVSRLSKACRDDIFWEAVWPRLLARGWRSEQPKDRCHIKSKEHIVFIVPGVKKFSRRELVKQNHYFDSISSIIAKVISEPELLEFETSVEESICEQSNQEKHRYLKAPNSSSTHVKFTVVDSTSLASGGKLCQLRELNNPNPKTSTMERFQIRPLEVYKRADGRKWERRQVKKLVNEPERFMIVDTGVQSLGLRRWRQLPRECVLREAFGDSSQNQTDTNTGVKTDSGVKEIMVSVQQGCSKKKLARTVSSLPLPKRRRLSECVKKDIKRCGESSVLEPPVLDQNLKTNQSEETGSGMSLHVGSQERTETEPNGLCPVNEQQQEPNELGSKEEGAPNELTSSEKQQHEESNQFCRDKKCASKDVETTQQQEQLIQSPSTDHGTTRELASMEQQEEEEHKNQHTNTDIPRRQSTRKRPLTTRALEALEAGFCTANSTTKRSKRDRTTKVKHSANGTSRSQGESHNGFLVKEDIEVLEPSFLGGKAITASKHVVDQIEDSKKVTSEFRKLPRIVLKLPFKRG